MSTDKDIEIAERLTRLEVQVQQTDEDVAELSEQLAPLVRKFDKYEGRLGGVLIVISAVTMALKIFWGSISEYFGA